MKNMPSKNGLVLAVALSTSCGAAEPLTCEETSFTKEPVCQVPISNLIQRPNYDGRVVRVTGFLSRVNINGREENILFTSVTAAKDRNFAQAVALGPFSKEVEPGLSAAYRREISRTERYVDVVLRFSDSGPSDRGTKVAGWGRELFAVQTPPPKPRTPDL